MRKPPREWSTYTYYDPRGVLIKLRELETELGGVPMEDRVRRLRTHALRPFHERRQAAIFCYGMSTIVGTAVRVAPVENEDFDCIAHWKRGDEDVFTAIQIKELVPADLNPNADLNAELLKLTKYVTSHDLVVAFHVNRRMELKVSEIAVPALPIRELWLFGAVAPDGSEYMIWGDLLSYPQRQHFLYPTQ